MKKAGKHSLPKNSEPDVALEIRLRLLSFIERGNWSEVDCRLRESRQAVRRY